MGEVDSDSLILQVKVKAWVAAGGQMGFRARYDCPEAEGAIYIIKKGMVIVQRSLVTEGPSACVHVGAPLALPAGTPTPGYFV